MKFGRSAADVVVTIKTFDGTAGLKRIKQIQKLVRPLGYLVYVHKHYDGTPSALDIWTSTLTPWDRVEDTLRLNKLWPPIPPPPKSREKGVQKIASARDIFKASLERG